MPVLPNSGGGLGQALLGGVDAFRQGRRDKRAQELFEQQIADAEYNRTKGRAQDAASGLHVLGKGEMAPMDVFANIRDDAGARTSAFPRASDIGGTDFTSFVDPQPRMEIPQGTTPPIVSRAGAGAVNTPGAPQSFLDRMKASTQASRGPRYEFGQGYYVDRQPQFDAEDRARSVKTADQFEQALIAQQMQQGERDRKAGLYAGAGVPSSRAALYAENPSLAATDPNFTRQAPALPRNIDPLSAEGIKAAADRAGAVARAEAPFRRDPNAAPPPRPVQPSEFSNKAALVYPRAVQAAHILDEFFDKGAPAESALSHVPLIGNYLQSETSQRLNQAAETVASAILRLESGAAISDGEVKRYAQQFLPQPGDSPQVRAQKRATLQTQLERLRAASAPSMGGTTPVVSGDTAVNPWRRP